MDDNSASSSQPSPTSTPTPKIRAVELERYVQANRRISMSIAPSTEKSISPHVVRFSQAIGVCGSQPLSEDEICETVLGRRSDTQKALVGDPSPSSVRWPVRAVSRPRRNPRSPQTARDCLNQSFLSFLSRSNKIKSLSLFPYTNNLRPSLGSSKLWNVVSNISRCVSVNDGKLWGLKTHDSHILLQQLIPIATIRVSDLNRLEADIVLILCKLERISPPTFFDVMIHLAVYLQAKTKIVGPVSYSWMYPIEKLANRERFNRNPRNDDSMNRQLGCGDFDVFKQNVRPMGGSVVRTLSEDEKRMCHCNWKIVQTVQNKQVWDIPESGEVEDDRFELLEACSSIGVDESIHDIPFCRGDVESTVVDHEETDNQDQSRIDDDFINDETEQLESSDSDNQARLALTEVEQTNTPSVDPSTPSGIGTAVRNTIPLGCENLKVVPMGVRELVIDRLEMQNTFREFRADLHKYYCEFDDPVEARANPPNRITLEDWNMMCDRWETDAWKKKREKNKRSRSAVMFNHVTEANSFLQVRYELKKKKGCDVDEIEVFHETHFREKEGWINDKAKDASLEMQRIITESTEAGVQTISSAKACEFVLRSRSMQTVNPRSGESLRSNVSSTCEKEKNEMAYQLMKS
ncbi:uncharacterized protein E5676_scaffold986G00340 [Cucumis melo var. makuwa]|uniref:DUF4218 domain-containing protein n=1 Tax=Cucumis melo var. makuwa TaxID=1194695 RepID=A0A5D3BA62_CUCMM|nr:uncharacterized protein E5676_scaffold986G00340 [Cucumis melo var. makuwa]